MDKRMPEERGTCPACGGTTGREVVHNGVGWETGPWGCEDCDWREGAQVKAREEAAR